MLTTCWQEFSCYTQANFYLNMYNQYKVAFYCSRDSNTSEIWADTHKIGQMHILSTTAPLLECQVFIPKAWRMGQGSTDAISEKIFPSFLPHEGINFRLSINIQVSRLKYSRKITSSKYSAYIFKHKWLTHTHGYTVLYLSFLCALIR